MNCARRSTLWILGILMFGAAAPAAAQTPRWDVSVGYQLLHIPNNYFPVGFNVDVSSHRSVWDVVGEFGMAHNSLKSGNGSVNIYNVAGGIRASVRKARVTPFAQVLVGAEITSANLVSGGDTDGAFMIQTGGGVYVSATDRWGVFAQADFRPVFFQEEVDEQHRFVFGARFVVQ